MYFGNKADKEVTNCSLSLKAQSAFFHSLSLKSQETCRETNEEAFSFCRVYTISWGCWHETDINLTFLSWLVSMGLVTQCK